MADTVTQIHSLAIGGGSDFHAEGWYNLEEIIGPNNPRSFVLAPDCVFPFAAGSLQRVYSSHCLEHLNIPTVVRVLSESLRVLRVNGDLIIKLPDFELVLQRWQEQDETFFHASRWGFASIIPTWKNRGMDDCLDYRAAMIFCGFWNREYGEHFARKISTSHGAYHGPPAISRTILTELRDQHSPGEISRLLRDTVLAGGEPVKFNHQTAWSRQEFRNLLQIVGFSIISEDKRSIINRYADIPQIAEMVDISMFFLMKKTTSRRDKEACGFF